MAIFSACGSGSVTTTTGSPDDASPDTADFLANPACMPDPTIEIEPLTGEDRRFESIEAFLTGYRLEDFPEGEEPANADANWGGIWGDFKAGIVVAVLDCTLVDLNEVAQLAGPSGTLRIIEVPYTVAETEQFKNDLYQALLAADIPGSVPVDSTLIGREITVKVAYLVDVPDNFAPTVPRDAYEIVAVGIEGLDSH
jgi:hypothetical protein